jgi:Fe-S-cluster-containing dehydrogenase component
VAACPEQAIVFGDLDEPGSDVARASHDDRSFRFLSRLGTEPKVYYRTSRQWVRAMAERSATREGRESHAA